MISAQALEQLRGLRAGIFERLSDEQLGEVAAACDEVSYPAGRFVFRECDLTSDLYIVVLGAIQLGHGLDQQGRADIVAQVEVGDTFGELALFDELPRSMDARAAVDSRLLYLSLDKWNGLVGQDPALGVQLLGYMAREVSFRLRRANWDLVILKHQD